MKLYTLSTFETGSYTTANWFFATSKEKAIELLKEAIDKVKIATDKIQRAEVILESYFNTGEIKKLKEERDNLWKDWVVPDDEEYSKTYQRQQVIWGREDAIEKRIREINEILRSRNGHKVLYRITHHYSNFNRAELLYESFEEQIKYIKEIDADKVLPLVQTNGD